MRDPIEGFDHAERARRMADKIRPTSMGRALSELQIEFVAATVTDRRMAGDEIAGRVVMCILSGPEMNQPVSKEAFDAEWDRLIDALEQWILMTKPAAGNA